MAEFYGSVNNFLLIRIIVSHYFTGPGEADLRYSRWGNAGQPQLDETHCGVLRHSPGPFRCDQRDRSMRSIRQEVNIFLAAETTAAHHAAADTQPRRRQ